MTSFEIKPYVSVGPFCFGMTEAEVLALGQIPRAKSKNSRGEANWLYDGYSVRFGKADGRLCDVGFSRLCDVTIKGIPLFADRQALQKVLDLDSDVYEFYGFLVFFGLGITLGGFHDENESEKGGTAFTRGHWDSFRSDPSFRKWPETES